MASRAYHEVQENSGFACSEGIFSQKITKETKVSFRKVTSRETLRFLRYLLL